MVEAEVALRECLETTAKELDVCKQHFKQKVTECDDLETQQSDAERLKLDHESQIYQLSKLNETLRDDLLRLKSKQDLNSSSIQSYSQELSKAR